MACFDESYYDGIWGTVHRHDYCESLARVLALEGRSILDIGTGCGYLVHCLRDLGVEAFGVEISEFALANTCSPYVLVGSVLALPFADGQFDIVHSQGLWEYIAEADIPTAVAECKRVGRRQRHDWERSDVSPWYDEYRAVTWRPSDWWRQWQIT